MPSSSDTITPITPPILHLALSPLEEQKKALIAKTQNLIVEFPMFKDELNLPLINLKWSGNTPAKIQENINKLSAAVEQVEKKRSSIEQGTQQQAKEESEEEHQKAEALAARTKQTGLKQLKTEATELVNQAKILRDFGVFTIESENLLLSYRRKLSIALASDNESLIKENMNQLSILLNGVSRPLNAGSPDPKEQRVSFDI